MEFRTRLDISHKHELIDYRSKILILGSCFSEHVFKHLSQLKFDCFLNPCGISYNPISIAKGIDYALGRKSFDSHDIINVEDRCFHYDFHGSFTRADIAEATQVMSSSIEMAISYSDAKIVLISLGSSFAYQRKVTGHIVNNCHKVSADQFERKFLEIDQTIEVLSDAINKYLERVDDAQFIFTVSPVRHIKDGLVSNNRSKSSLLLACAKLEEHFPNVHYFPSYELLLDDLRDYRFYAKDMIHPSGVAVEYIMKQFDLAFLSSKEEPLRKRIRKINSSLAHRPFLVNSENHQMFLKKLEQELLTLSQHDDIDFSKELEHLRSQRIS